MQNKYTGEVPSENNQIELVASFKSFQKKSVRSCCNSKPRMSRGYKKKGNQANNTHKNKIFYELKVCNIKAPL